MRPVLALLAGLLMTTGCDRPGTPPAAAPAPDPTDAPAVPLPADGSALAFVDAAGAPAATLTCTRNELRIVASGFQPIASEERLSIGTEGEAFALVADLAAPGPGVTASGVPDSDLLNRLARGEALFAMYGRQSAGPLTAASPPALQAMISACRGPE